MADDGDERSTTGSSWPPPHPSPPLPPPREYGVPGTGPDRRPLIAGAVAVVVLVVAVVLVLVLVRGGDDDPQPQVARDRTSASASASTSTAAAPYTCWNGSGAAAVSDCPEPDGEKGLEWVFPTMAAARCGRLADDGGPGVVARVLCIYRASDGTRVNVGYYQWASVDQGLSFYDDQGLQRTDPPGGDGTVTVHTWTGGDKATTKNALLYADAPFSVTMTYPKGTTLSAEDQAALASRPPDQVRGVPAQ